MLKNNFILILFIPQFYLYLGFFAQGFLPFFVIVFGFGCFFECRKAGDFGGRQVGG
jgi:hypothetical protein